MYDIPTIAVVGSGPIGSTYARLLLEAIPSARVVMFEAGPQLTERPGESVRNIVDPARIRCGASRGLRREHLAGGGRPPARRHHALGRRRHGARPLLEDGTDTAMRFQLRDLTLVRRIEHDGTRVRGVVVEDLRTGEQSSVEADAVVVAADAFRSPQLLWASGIRPAPLGRYLTEHHVVISTVALDGERMSDLVSDEELDAELSRRAKNSTDPVAAVNRIPFSEPEHPYSAQIMYAETPPFPLEPGHPAAGNRWGYVNMGYGVRKFPRVEDGVRFSDDELDYRGLPNFTTDYAVDAEERREIDEATDRLRRAGRALGTFIAEPRLLPFGSSLHYMGTMRAGTDPADSVADPYSRVWGFENLVVGGNALIPTANTMNPTLTSVAIAVRGARHLAKQIAARPQEVADT